MGKKDKNKAEKKAAKKKKNKLLKNGKELKLKKVCCEKYKKGEHKRCKNCPRFDLT